MSGRIDVVMYRDPDSETELRVFVNGEDVTDELHVIDFDPGRGHMRSDVEEERDGMARVCMQCGARTYTTRAGVPLVPLEQRMGAPRLRRHRDDDDAP